MRRLAAVAAALLLAVASAPPALAIEPPAIDPGAVPPDDTGPDQAMEQRKICSAPTVLPNSNFADKPWAADYLHLAEAQKFATGAGVTVAVIDTGVNASPRVPAEPGGDFVDKGGNGLSDCDAHGTLTASIIAGRPAPTDAFIGVAPEARILSLRQTSEAFQPKDSRSDPNDPNTTQTAGSLRSLARAIVHAANLGAQVSVSPEYLVAKMWARVAAASSGDGRSRLRDRKSLASARSWPSSRSPEYMTSYCADRPSWRARSAIKRTSCASSTSVMSVAPGESRTRWIRPSMRAVTVTVCGGFATV